MVLRKLLLAGLVLAVLRAVAAGPVVCAVGDLQREALQRVNAVRTAGHRCGARAMPPTSVVGWDVSLDAAASSHSHDMAQRDYFEHRSPEGQGVRERAAAYLYPARMLGENIARGDSGIEEAMQSWMDSVDHCSNIMDPEFTDLAVACASQPGIERGTYWTMLLGRKR